MFKRPMLLCGIICSIISALGFISKSFIVIFALPLPILIGLIIYKKADAKFLFTSALIFAFCLNMLLTINKIESLKTYAGTEQRAEMVVLNVSYKSDEYYKSDVEVMKSDDLPKGTKLSVFYEPESLEVGKRISANIKIKDIQSNSSKKMNYCNEIYLSANMSDIQVIDSNGDFVLMTAERIKAYIKNTLFKYMDYSEAGTLCALIFGEREYFTDEFYNYVKAAGVSHIMVVSGMHLSIFVLFFVKICERLFYNKYIKAFIIFLVVILLSVLCGFTMSILRAGFTYIIMALGIMLDRRGNAENTLGAAMTVILMLSPFAVFSVSLQLSMLSTFGILAVALPIIKALENNDVFKIGFVKTVISSIIISLSAMLLTLPVTIYVFGYVSTVSVLANLLISSAVTFVICLALIGLILNLVIPLISPPVFYLTQVITDYINTVIEKLGSKDYATMEIPKRMVYLSLLAVFTVFWTLLCCKRRKNVLKLNQMKEKIVKEGGGKLKWH